MAEQEEEADAEGINSASEQQQQQNDTPLLRFGARSAVEGGRQGLPCGAVLSPFAHVHPPPPALHLAPALCLNCAAYINPFCSTDSASGTWRCCFCKHSNPGYSERSKGPELASSVVEYIQQDAHSQIHTAGVQLATGPHRRRGSEATTAAASGTHAIALVIDGNACGQALADLAGSIAEVLPQLDQGSSVALLVFTGVVTVFRLARDGAAVAHVLPATRVLPPAATLAALGSAAGATFGTLRWDGAKLAQILSSLKGSDGGGGGGGGSARNRALWPNRRKRGLGAAVAYALQLIRAEPCATAHVVVCTEGGASWGPGAAAAPDALALTADADPERTVAAVAYFAGLGEQASAGGIGVDLFCAGARALGAATLHALTRPTGGVVVARQTFGAAFQRDLLRVLSQPPGAAAAAAAAAAGLRACVLDVRTCARAELLRVVGPASSTDAHGGVDDDAYRIALAAAQGGRFDASAQAPAAEGLLRLRVGRADPCLALALYFSDPAKGGWLGGVGAGGGGGDWVHVQCVARFLRGGGVRVTRVISARLPVVRADSIPAAPALEDVDVAVTAVLIAKTAVLKACEGEETGADLKASALQAQAHVVAALRAVAKAHRSAARAAAAASARHPSTTNTVQTTQPFPPQLEGLVPLLYHLHRGALLGRMRLSADEVACARHLFLRAPAEDCARMMAPALCVATEAPLPLPPLAGADAALAGAYTQQQELSAGAMQQGWRHSNQGELRDFGGGTGGGSGSGAGGVPSGRDGGLHTGGSLGVVAGKADGVITSSAVHNANVENINDDDDDVRMTLVPVAPETLAMLPHRVLVMDTHDALYVWSGARAAGDARARRLRDAAIDAAAAAAAARFPCAEVTVLREGQSWCRHLLCRLAPSHMDAEVGRGRSDAAIAELCVRLPHTDDLTLRQFTYSVVGGV
ncbi:hypothetical protein JKP88DRAFT_301546 [Tribonema minus]|uniref:Protein transport protein SEC23 n=1 Tax=Tribonema minus TaxID=303371 RepID=A0A835ZAM5_9STRA|nr:hypothetical protein JKP88DRAFT_301546 [Tribonema minus]